MLSLVVSLSCLFGAVISQQCNTITTTTETPLVQTIFAETQSTTQEASCLTFGQTTNSYLLECSAKNMVIVKKYANNNCGTRASPTATSLAMDAAGLTTHLTTEIGRAVTVSNIVCCQVSINGCGVGCAGCQAAQTMIETCVTAYVSNSAFEYFECMGPNAVQVTGYGDLANCTSKMGATVPSFSLGNGKSTNCTHQTAFDIYSAVNGMCYGTYNLPMTTSPTTMSPSKSPTMSPLTTTTMMTTTSTTVTPASATSKSSRVNSFLGMILVVFTTFILYL